MMLRSVVESAADGLVWRLDNLRGIDWPRPSKKCPSATPRVKRDSRHASWMLIRRKIVLTFPQLRVQRRLNDEARMGRGAFP